MAKKTTTTEEEVKKLPASEDPDALPYDPDTDMGTPATNGPDQTSYVAPMEEYEVDPDSGQVNTQVGNGINMHLMPKVLGIDEAVSKDYDAGKEK